MNAILCSVRVLLRSGNVNLFNSQSVSNRQPLSQSRFGICHHLISALLSGGPPDACHRFRHSLPARFLDHLLLSSLSGKAVALKFSTPASSHLPFRVIQAVLHLQEVIDSPLNMRTGLPAVSRTTEKRSRDQHVKRAL